MVIIFNVQQMQTIVLKYWSVKNLASIVIIGPVHDIIED